MKCFYYPFGENYNSYNKGMIDALNLAGFDVEGVGSFKSLLLSFDILTRNRIYILNWFEDYPFVHGKVQIYRLFVFLLYLLFFKITGKLVVVEHNLISHHNKGRLPLLLKKLLYWTASMRFAHSKKYACEQNISYIPHPLYRILEGRSESKNAYWVCIGMVKEYKGLEWLLERWPREKKLVLAGKSDEAYALRLRSIIIDRGLDVDLLDSYLSDQDLATLVSSSNGVVLSHKSDSCIVSGAAYFAYSCKTPLYVRNVELMERLNFDACTFDCRCLFVPFTRTPNANFTAVNAECSILNVSRKLNEIINK